MYDEINNEYILNLEEACEQLKIGKSSLYQLMRNKELKAFKIGRNWKIPASSITEYINQQCNFRKK